MPEFILKKAGFAKSTGNIKQMGEPMYGLYVRDHGPAETTYGLVTYLTFESAASLAAYKLASWLYYSESESWEEHRKYTSELADRHARQLEDRGLNVEGKSDYKQQYYVGHLVQKIKGYEFDGMVVAAFPERKGQWRYCVQNKAGIIHIFEAAQLKKAE